MSTVANGVSSPVTSPTHPNCPFSQTSLPSSFLCSAAYSSRLSCTMTTTGPMLILPPIPDSPPPPSTRTVNDPAARLRWAIVNDNLSLVTRIVRRYPDLLQQRDPANGWTSLHYAGYYGHYLICVFLINQGHDKDEISLDFDRNTPLHLAAQKNQEQTVHYLAQHIRRCLDWRNDQMESALMVAAKMGHQPCITLLLDFGANVDLPGPSGNRAIHIAAAYGHIKAIRTLVDRGADTSTSNSLGFTPLHYSLSYQVHDYLQALIADKKKQKTSAVPPTSPGFTFKWNKSTSPPASTSSSNTTTTNNSTNNSSANLSAGSISGSASVATNKPYPLHHSSTILNVPVVAKPQHSYKSQQQMPPLAAAPSLAPVSQTSLPTFAPANRMNPNSPRSDSPSNGSSSADNGKSTSTTTMLKSPLPLTKSPSYKAVNSPIPGIEVLRKEPVKSSNFSMPLPLPLHQQPLPQQKQPQPEQQLQQPQQQPQQQKQQQKPTQHQHHSHHQHHSGQKPHIAPTVGAKPPPPPIKQHIHASPPQQPTVKPSPNHTGSKPVLNVNTIISNRKGSISNGNPSKSTSSSNPYPYSQPYPLAPPQYSSMAKAAAASSSSLVDSSNKNLGVSSPSSGITSSSASSNTLRGQPPPPPPPPPPAMHPEHVYKLSLYNQGNGQNSSNSSSSSSVSTGGSAGAPPSHRKPSMSKKPPIPVPPVKPPHLHSVPSSGNSLGSSGRTRVLDVNVSTGRRPSRN